ncbi:Pkinase-domain-containing protein [Pseudovirgaria hyperparasitica]|uniref:non-specific serine/threonine protein kinase n=1 Tax=Pseudovirgaria hyperparasitica TaxID=470096 RepID=A0A6A6W406_9PEZI|nr:Pkinase-domain-containing protein [Pseudovirgaria hyperparasitica]KAF2756696.1 Pkinase-domain-containing protein [Pseudovirgaria hyperparasitica]
MDGSQTQVSTQRKDDPRRFGRNNSGLVEGDISDVICILHPASMAAYRIVASTAQHAPEHVLQNQSLISKDGSPVPLEEQETFKLENPGDTSHFGLDLALRFSTKTKEPWSGFVFGRNAHFCDVVMSVDSVKRVSNRHFRIFVKDTGIVMLEDTSTNGTMIDDIHLKGKSKSSRGTATRMLTPGAIIHIVSTKPDEYIKFIVRLPSREGYKAEFEQNLRNYRQACRLAEVKHLGTPLPEGVDEAPETFGMHWNGDKKYNVVGQLGKGAFATVYLLATALDGNLVAAKELEKRRFIKNGQIDQRLDNEMRIMQDLRHPNIVQYIDYHDFDKYLYIIMEYVPHGDLQGYLAEHKVLPEYRAKQMARQILQALHYLHQRDITHRDIKPDNILIASFDPFEVKLTDFGLSKVVKDDTTFLKTFCGTLLYCAPEVFPFFKDTQSSKRRRPGGHGRKPFHSYSQSVDIWSFAAVLWFALCGQPPFKGITDTNGKGMFNQITTTDLDDTPLRQEVVSDDAIDLLHRMLDTDPSRRLTEVDCLKHPWLNDGSVILDNSSLGVIQEEEVDSDVEEGLEHTWDPASAGAEQEFSQMSLGAQHQGFDDEYEPNPLDSPEFKAMVTRPYPSKRFKSDPLFPRNQTRDLDMEDMRDDSSDSIHGPTAGDSQTLPDPQARQVDRNPRLFGEIGGSALHSSGVLNARTHQALDLRDASTSTDDSEFVDLNMSRSYDLASPTGLSLEGTDSRFRDMELIQDQAAPSLHTFSEGTNGVHSPHTPNVPPSTVTNLSGSSGKEEETPKATAQPFNRRAEIPISASSFFDPHDPSTHNVEYASRVSGIDFSQQPHAYVTSRNAAIALANNPITPKDLPSSQSAPGTDSAESSSQFVRPNTRLGRLTSIDSIANITINLDSPYTSFGRWPECSVQYRPVDDSRVPKKAFEIWFHHPEIKEYLENGQDFTQLEGLHTGITTWSSQGIWINGVHLTKLDKNGRTNFGRIHTGDIITVFKNPETKMKLQFKVELFKGEGAKVRTNRREFFIQRTF